VKKLMGKLAIMDHGYVENIRINNQYTLHPQLVSLDSGSNEHDPRRSHHSRVVNTGWEKRRKSGFGRMINPVVKIMTNVAETHPSRGQYGNIVGEFSSDQACREIF
jgi:hypothetical protein